MGMTLVFAEEIKKAYSVSGLGLFWFKEYLSFATSPMAV
jgi:hypothetical protein